MEIKILGCGNSVGVPIIGCKCDVCTSDNIKNKRSRSSIFVKTNDTKILIDSSPDLRIQALKNNIDEIDGVFYTHGHSDHTAGIHELSVFPQSKYESEPVIPIYTDKETMENLNAIAGYIFIPKSVGGAPWKRCYLRQNNVDYYQEFYIAKEKFFIFPQEHGRINCSGIIINDKFAYCTDVRVIPDCAIQVMREHQLKLLIIECFCYRDAPAHSNLEMAVEYIKQINPERAFLTHMSHEVEYDDVIKKLKLLNMLNVNPAYDGLTLKV